MYKEQLKRWGEKGLVDKLCDNFKKKAINGKEIVKLLPPHLLREGGKA